VNLLQPPHSQLKQWSGQYDKNKGQFPLAGMDDLIAWLQKHAPAQSSVGIVHGDYRFDMIVNYFCLLHA
jgi:aminoglycoside phosphotransferase (APT) family kinase protein